MTIQSRVSFGFGYGAQSVATFGFLPEQQQNTGRSGWYRLMLSEIQEESLRQDAEKKKLKEEAVVAKENKVDAPVKVIIPSKPKRIAVMLEKVFTPHVVELPKYIKSSVVPDDNLSPWLTGMTIEFREWFAQAIPMQEVLYAKIADNDEEEFIELMLMAA